MYKIAALQSEKRCPKCKYFFMEFDKIKIPAIPIKHKHKCNNKRCEHIEFYEVKYPYIKYEEVYED